MIRFYFPIVTLAGVMSMVACSESGPVADGADNAATATADIGVLPPDKSAATPTKPQNGATERSNTAAPAASGKIPASLQGRWGMTPADCTSTRGDAKGLLLVSGDTLKFYETIARPAADTKSSADSISGNFTFTGEGMNWTKYQALELQEGKLVRTESGPMASYTYARCTS